MTDTAPAAPQRPTARFMLPRLHAWIALGFGSGLSPRAPGTIGTLWGWLSFLVLSRWLSDAGWALVIAAALLVVTSASRSPLPFANARSAATRASSSR